MEPEGSGSLPGQRLQGQGVRADLGGEKSARCGLRSFAPVTPENTDRLTSSSQNARSFILKRHALRAATQIMLPAKKPRGILYKEVKVTHKCLNIC